MDIGLDLKKANEEGFQEGYQLGTVHGMNAVTDEEFKVEAKRRGYNLIPIAKKVIMFPCVCGRVRIACYCISGGYEFYQCKCGLVGEKGKNNKQARLNWNKMIEEKMKDAGKEND